VAVAAVTQEAAVLEEREVAVLEEVQQLREPEQRGQQILVVAAVLEVQVEEVLVIAQAVQVVRAS
jgi:hypothetical protein